VPWRSFDDKSREFVSLYRRRFKLPPRRRGRHVFVDFEGVTTSTDVDVTEGVALGSNGRRKS
jgi:beta-galactosidase